MLTIHTGDYMGLPYLLDVRPTGEFSYDAARNKLMQLNIGADNGTRLFFIVPGDTTYHEEHDENGETLSGTLQGNLLRLQGWIHLESRVTVRTSKSFACRWS